MGYVAMVLVACIMFVISCVWMYGEISKDELPAYVYKFTNTEWANVCIFKGNSYSRPPIRSNWSCKTEILLIVGNFLIAGAPGN